jgi:hypothetical protein
MLIQKIIFVCRFRDGGVRWLVYEQSLPLMTSLACLFTFERAVCWGRLFCGVLGVWGGGGLEILDMGYSDP